MINDRILKIIILGLAIANLALCYNFPFFWDHIALTANFANHFYENGLFPPVVPQAIDHGHPTFFALYLCNIWHFLGRNLWVSHLAMLPFLVLLGWQWLKLIQYFLPPKYHLLGLIALLFEPSLLAQSTMVGTEIPLIAGVLLALNGVIYQKNTLKFWGLLLCACLSLRGSMWCMVIFITDFLSLLPISTPSSVKNKISDSLKNLVPYFGAGTIILIWYSYHYWQMGYLLVGKNSIWAENHVWNFSLSVFLYNSKMLAWCIGDFGRFAYFAFLAVMLLVAKFFSKSSFQKTLSQPKVKTLVFFLVGTGLIYFPVMLFRAGNILRRYLIPFYLVALLLFLVFILACEHKKIRFVIVSLAAGILVSGHFWIYPERLAQDWDASLAHLPYFKIERQMRSFLEEKNINFEDIAVGFPTYNSDFATYLSHDKRKMHPIRIKDQQSVQGFIKRYDQYQYVIYSNIYNVLQTSEINKLNNTQNFTKIKSFESNGVYMNLYKVQ